MYEVPLSAYTNNRAYKTAMSPVINEATQKGMACKKLFFRRSLRILSNADFNFLRIDFSISIDNYKHYAIIRIEIRIELKCHYKDKRYNRDFIFIIDSFKLKIFRHIGCDY